jgi:hypothetical protein
VEHVDLIQLIVLVIFGHIELADLVAGATDPLMILVSGGHTTISAFGDGYWRIFGETEDITLGNLFDMFARKTGLPSPGGPSIEKAAKNGKKYVDLPYIVKGNDVSYSGLLTAAENLHSNYEKMVRVIRPVLKEIDDYLSSHGIPHEKEVGYPGCARRCDWEILQQEGITINVGTVVGKPTPRVDLPRKFTGQASFIQDLRLPGMLHGRLVRPPGPGAQLISIDERSVEGVPGLVKVHLPVNVHDVNGQAGHMSQELGDVPANVQLDRHTHLTDEKRERWPLFQVI